MNLQAVASSIQENRLSSQPFVVQCLTCGSQLRVTDPAAVGTIATCPKCHSMVQIERPGHQVAAGASSIDSQAITEEAISADEGASLGTTNSTASGFVGDGEATAAFTDASHVSPMPPAWQSDRTQRSRQIALVVAVSVTSLFVAVAGFVWFVQSSRDRSASVQDSRQSAQDLVDSAIDVSPEAIPAADSREEQPEPPLSDQTVPDQAAANTEDREASRDQETATPSAVSIAEEAPDRTNIVSPPDDLIPRSPLDPPTSQTPEPPAPRAPDSTPDEGESGVSGSPTLPPGLEQYTKFLLTEGPVEKTNLEAPPTMDEVTIDAAADELDDPTTTVRPKEINLKADLAVRMALDTKGYPLPDLALLIGQISRVPIQIDWVSFDLAGLDLDAPVKPPEGWQTAREILDATAAELGAELRDEESLVILTLTDESFDLKLASLAELSDFGDGQESAKQVLIDFLRGEGEQAGTELPQGVSREDRQISAIAIDALRRMRGISPKVEDDRFHRWAWASNDPTGQWTPLTGGDAGPQLDTPITVAGFLRRMAKRNGAANLVNWYDLARRGVAPERMILPHTKADAGETMAGVLRPLGLEVRKVDAGHWWIGRESTYDRLPVVVWTPPLGDLGDRFVEDLSNIMAGASRDDFRVTVDPQSNRALILLPRFIVRQLGKLAGGVAVK